MDPTLTAFTNSYIESLEYEINYLKSEDKDSAYRIRNLDGLELLRKLLITYKISQDQHNTKLDLKDRPILFEGLYGVDIEGTIYLLNSDEQKEKLIIRKCKVVKYVDGDETYPEIKGIRWCVKDLLSLIEDKLKLYSLSETPKDSHWIRISVIEIQ